MAYLKIIHDLNFPFETRFSTMQYTKKMTKFHYGVSAEGKNQNVGIRPVVGKKVQISIEGHAFPA